MTSGKQVYDTIEENIRDLEVESQILGDKISSTQESIRTDVTTQEGLYIKLSKISVFKFKIS